MLSIEKHICIGKIKYGGPLTIRAGTLLAFKRLVSSIKVEVKKKHFCIGRTFSCFAAHWMEQDLF